MTDIDHRIAGFLHDEADRAALPDEMYQRVLRRARIRRLVTATAAGVAMIAVVMASVLATGVLRSPSTIAPVGPEDLPAPPDSLREQIPDELDNWIEPGLVLLYRDGGVYHLFFEGVVPHSCPFGAPERDPEACFITAQHLIWDRATPDASGGTGDHDLELPELVEEAEVLWRGLPEEGSIGIRSPGACERIERFEGYYECRGGVPVYVREERGRSEAAATGTKDCPTLLRPGRNARRQAEAAARRWTRRVQKGQPSGTEFGIEVAPGGGPPEGGCSPSRIPNRKRTWKRTWIGRVSWRYPDGSGIGRSASLASNTIFLGRTPRGWEVYFQFH